MLLNVYFQVHAVWCWALLCSAFSLRLTWLGLNGSGMFGKVQHRPRFSSRWRRRTPSCAASAAAWKRRCWVCGEGTTRPAAGSCGSSGGEKTRTLLSSYTTNCQVSRRIATLYWTRRLAYTGNDWEFGSQLYIVLIPVTWCISWDLYSYLNCNWM